MGSRRKKAADLVNFPAKRWVLEGRMVDVANATSLDKHKLRGVFLVINVMTRCVLSYIVFFNDLAADQAGDGLIMAFGHKNSPTVEIVHVDQHKVYNSFHVQDALKLYKVRLSQCARGNQAMESFNSSFKGVLVVLYLEGKSLSVVFTHFKPKKALKVGSRYKSLEALAKQKDVRAFVLERRDFMANLSNLTDRAVNILNNRLWENTKATRGLALLCLKHLEDATNPNLTALSQGPFFNVNKGLLQSQVEIVASHVQQGLKHPTTSELYLDMEDLVRLVENTPQGQTRLLLSMKRDMLESYSETKAELEGVKRKLDTVLREKDVKLEQKEAKLKQKEDKIRSLSSRLASLEEDYGALLKKQTLAKERSEKRKRRKIRIKRDVVSLEEFQSFMAKASFSSHRLTRSRPRLVLCLLYITGCRIDELRLLRLSNVSQMFIRKNPYFLSCAAILAEETLWRRHQEQNFLQRGFL